MSAAMHDLLAAWRHARETLGAMGYALPPEPPAPGRWVRIPAAGKGERNRSAGVTLLADGAVRIVDHAAGYSDTLQPRRATVTDVAELRRLRAEAKRAQRIAERKQRERHRAGTEAARTTWARASAVVGRHPYLEAKGVTLPGCRLDTEGRLLVPLTNADGALQTIQRIAPDGSKRTFPGAPLTGAAYRIGRLERKTNTALICEGAATGATLAAETGHAVVCAMFAGNLEAVAQALRARYPRADIVVCGDDDRQAVRNVGRVKATAAARAVGGRVAFPVFCEGCSGCSDFNDVAACARCRGAA